MKNFADQVWELCFEVLHRNACFGNAANVLLVMLADDSEESHNNAGMNVLGLRGHYL